MKQYVIFLVVLLALLQKNTFAQKADTIIYFKSNKEAIQYALQFNQDIELLSLKQTQSKIVYKASKSYRYPQISLNAIAQKNIDLPTTLLPGELFGQEETIEAEFGSEYFFNAGLTVKQNLFDLHHTLKSRIAKTEIDITKNSLENAKQNLKEQITLCYYSILIYKKALVYSQKDLETVTNIEQMIENRFKQGVIDKLVLNKIQIAKNKVLQSVKINTISIEQYKGQLKKLLGISQNTEIKIEEEIRLSPEKLLSDVKMLEDNSLKIQEKKLEKAYLNIKLKKANFLPKVYAFAFFNQQQYSDDFSLKFENNSWKKHNYVGLKIDIPIFTGFSNTQQLRIAKNQHDIAEKKLSQEREKSLIEDELLIKEYQNSVSMVDLTHKNFLLADENKNLIYSKYEQGIVDLNEYLKSFNDYLLNKNIHLNSLTLMYGYYCTIYSRK